MGNTESNCYCPNYLRRCSDQEVSGEVRGFGISGPKPKYNGTEGNINARVSLVEGKDHDVVL